MVCKTELCSERSAGMLLAFLFYDISSDILSASVSGVDKNLAWRIGEKFKCNDFQNLYFKN